MRPARYRGVVTLDRDTIVPSMGNNFGPRLGLAYQLDPKTVIRTGGSIMYDTWGSYIQFVQNPRGNWPTGAGQSPNGLNVGPINATAQNPFGTLLDDPGDTLPEWRLCQRLALPFGASI